MCSDFNSSGNFYLNIRQLRKHVFGNNWNWPLGFIWRHLVYGPLLMADSFPWSERDSRNLLRYFSFYFSIPSTSSTFHLHILKWVIYVKISLFKTFVENTFPHFWEKQPIHPVWEKYAFGNFNRNCSF